MFLYIEAGAFLFPSPLTYGYYRYALGGRGVSRPSPQKTWINKLRVCAVHQLRRPSTVMFKIIT